VPQPRAWIYWWRANHNRGITDEPFKLFERFDRRPETKVQIPIPRKALGRSSVRKKPSAKRPSRQAELEVRYQRINFVHQVLFRQSSQSTSGYFMRWKLLRPKELYLWSGFLLTTVDITSAEDAVQCLRWYCLRWRIEDFHRVLKSGCAIEKIGYETAERIRRAIAINLVIAWRIMLMTSWVERLRSYPPKSCSPISNSRFCKPTQKKKRLEPSATLHDTVRLVRAHWRYLGRKNDPEARSPIDVAGLSATPLCVKGSPSETRMMRRMPNDFLSRSAFMGQGQG